MDSYYLSAVPGGQAADSPIDDSADNHINSTTVL